ncbi:MAG: hypothetical protein JF607_27990 [Burkholderiales bacterium]|jgi:hypothetical protein|nr:hypothetical protein [Burkholderiales bacterium]
MKPLLPALLLAMTAALPMSAHAGPKADALAACLGDNTTGKDRKDLARWMFVAMAAHPEIKELSKASEAARDEADQIMGRLVTTLLAERCPAQTREVMQQEGTAGMFNAFRVLGELAMKELMSNPEVSKSLGSYERYLDQAKLKAALGDR